MNYVYGMHNLWTTVKLQPHHCIKLRLLKLKMRRNAKLRITNIIRTSSGKFVDTEIFELDMTPIVTYSTTYRKLSLDEFTQLNKEVLAALRGLK